MHKPNYIQEVEYSLIMDAYQQTAQIIKTMSHPVRLQILDALVDEGEACVCHLEWRLGVRQAALSQHLARMRDSDLVRDQRHGLNVYYSLASPEVAGLLDTLKQSSHRITSNPLIHKLPDGDLGSPCPCPRCNDKGYEPSTKE
jgi:ArsR family transcriptional regulator